MTGSGPLRGLCRIVSLAILLTAASARPALAVSGSTALATAASDPDICNDVPCETAAQCADDDPCTGDICSDQGVCQHEVQPFCIRCTTDSDCEDHDPCTTQVCGLDGSCQITLVPGCRRCTTAVDCNDHDDCTTDSCDGGVCAHARIADCPTPPEGCADGVDDDADGLVDCDDPDCATAPSCRPREICGNCIDDDGDGLVDYEDPDCCDATMPLAVSRMTLGPTTAPGRGSRLKVKAGYVSPAPALLDSTAEDTSLQISDARGQIFCATVAARDWLHPRRRLHRFRDETGAFAGGVAKGKLKVARDGGVTFRARGERMSLRATSGSDLLVTVRVGGQCARETISLRPRRNALVFP